MTVQMTAAEIRHARGLKRTCQSEACGARFYDLGRQDIACPICRAVFYPPVEVIAPVPLKRRGFSWGSHGANKASMVAPPVVAPELIEGNPGDAPPELPLDATADVVLDDIEDGENTDLDIVATDD